MPSDLSRNSLQFQRVYRRFLVAAEDKAAWAGDRATVLPVRVRDTELDELVGAGHPGGPGGHAAGGDTQREPARGNVVYERPRRRAHELLYNLLRMIFLIARGGVRTGVGNKG